MVPGHSGSLSDKSCDHNLCTLCRYLNCEATANMPDCYDPVPKRLHVETVLSTVGSGPDRVTE